MTDENSTGQSNPDVARRSTPLADRGDDLYEKLAQRAEDLAQTAELSAAIHAQMPPHLLSHPQHAEQEQMLAAAERAAAKAYRAHQVPPSDVRAAIRRAGQSGTTDTGEAAT
jgi:hypothetical protein